ncbi:MAG TPA: hypothetical protein VNY09_06150 [Candidatus Sulfotelmatobacter sp.]|jgi:hypothetical protein|nr:hypothetical protein [Candidatus Sulfotelmatobacter sp.]
MRNRFVFAMLAILSVFMGLQAADDPMLGSWKLNVGKSKLGSGAAIQAETNRVESYGGNGIKLTAEITKPDGSKVTESYAGTFDGKEFAVGGDANVDAAYLKRIDANTMERINKKAGKPTTTMHYVVSKDGKTKTVTITGTTAQGQPVDTVLVFEKQ